MNEKSILEEFDNLDYIEQKELIKKLQQNLKEVEMHPVSKFNELHQGTYKKGATWEDGPQSGTPQAPIFTVILKVERGKSYTGTGPNKKAARTDAAEKALNEKDKWAVNVNHV